MKLIGMLFIVVSAGSVGFRIAFLLKKRCSLVRQFLQALQVLRNEITFCATPLPQAFALMAVSSDGTLGRLFSDVAKDMDRRRWATPQAAMDEMNGRKTGARAQTSPASYDLGVIQKLLELNSNT